MVKRKKLVIRLMNYIPEDEMKILAEAQIKKRGHKLDDLKDQ